MNETKELSQSQVAEGEIKDDAPCRAPVEHNKEREIGLDEVLDAISKITEPETLDMVMSRAREVKRIRTEVVIEPGDIVHVSANASAILYNDYRGRDIVVDDVMKDGGCVLRLRGGVAGTMSRDKLLLIRKGGKNANND